MTEAKALMTEMYLFKSEVVEVRYNFNNLIRAYFANGPGEDGYLGRLISLQDSLTIIGQGELLGPPLRYALLLSIRYSFRNDYYGEGDTYLSAFKAGIKENRFELPVAEADPFVSDAYWEYCAYYIRRLNYKKAGAVLEEARAYLVDEGFIDQQIEEVLIPMGG